MARLSDTCLSCISHFSPHFAVASLDMSKEFIGYDGPLKASSATEKENLQGQKAYAEQLPPFEFLGHVQETTFDNSDLQIPQYGT